MKKPEIFKNKNIEAIDHNTKYCYLKEGQDNNTVKDVLDEIFNGIGYSYNKKVIIETNDKTITTYLIARSKGTVITLEDEAIPINEIKSITIKKDY